MSDLVVPTPLNLFFSRSTLKNSEFYKTKATGTQLKKCYRALPYNLKMLAPTAS